MAVQNILHYPHPLLKRVCAPVTCFGSELQTLVSDLVDTMHAGPGSVGVAAPQIGVAWRVCVVDVSASKLGKEDNHGLLVLVNPEIVVRDGRAMMREGCMSVPHYTGDVERATLVTVSYRDLQGVSQEVTSHGFEAVALQHEIDHLDGILFLDRITSVKTGLFRRKVYR